MDQAGAIEYEEAGSALAVSFGPVEPRLQGRCALVHRGINSPPARQTSSMHNGSSKYLHVWRQEKKERGKKKSQAYAAMYAHTVRFFFPRRHTV